MTALMHVAGWENSVNKVWMTVCTVNWLYMLPAPLTEFEKMNPECSNVGQQLHVFFLCFFLFLPQLFVVLHAKMVEGVLRQRFALVRLAGQEFDAKQVNHVVYPYMHSFL